MNRKTNAAGIALIKKYESCKLKPYICPAGIPTIGWGCTYYEDGTPVKITDKSISQERADKLFAAVLSGFESKANKAIISDITDNQFAAFMSLLFNCGPGKKGVKSGIITLKNGNPSTVLKWINGDPNHKATGEAFLAWCSPGTKFTAGLLKRRAAEVKLYFS